MILRRLRVEGFRCFRNPVELSGLGPGLTVIHGHNGTGKSSLLLAVARGLFDRYSARGGEMEQLRPWGTALSPRITMELEAAGRRCRVEKGFLDGASSTLSAGPGARFERVAEAQEADERIRGFLLGSLAGRGASELGHWGLARLLWLPQTAGRHTPPGLDEPVRKRLLDVVGEASLSVEEQGLLARIQSMWGSYFAKNGAQKRTGPRAEAALAVDAAQAEVEALVSRREAAVGLDAEVGRCEGRLGVLETERRAAEAERTKLESELAAESELERTLELHRRDEQALSARFEMAKARLHALDDAERRQRELRRGLEELAGQLTGDEAVLSDVRNRLATARTELDLAQRELERCERDQERAGLLERAQRLAADRSVLGANVRRAELLSGLVARAREVPQGPVATPEELEALEDAQRRIDQLEGRLEAMAVEVVFVAEGATRELSWETDGRRALVEAGPEERTVFRGVEGGVLEIRGVARVEVRPGGTELATVKEELARVRVERARKLARFGVGELAALRALQEEGLERARREKANELALKEALGPSHANIEDARRALRRLDEQLADAALKLGEKPDRIGGAQAPDAAPLVGAVKKARAAAREAGERHARLEGELRTGELRLEQRRRARSETEQQLAKVELDRQAWVSKHGEREQAEAEANRLATEVTLARRALADLKTRLASPERRASQRRRELDEALAALAHEERQVRDALAAARALLAQAAAEGIYSRLCLAEERLALAKETLAREQQREAAIRRLYVLAGERRDRLERSLVVPVESAARAHLEGICGAAAPELVFAPDLSEGTVRAADREAPLEALSWGTQEQAMLALRLALGELLSSGPSGEPQLVVLDDPLVNADGLRHERALARIARAAERLQVLVLTAFPERYRSLGAKDLDLAQAVGREGQVPQLSVG